MVVKNSMAKCRSKDSLVEHGSLVLCTPESRSLVEHGSLVLCTPESRSLVELGSLVLCTPESRSLVELGSLVLCTPESRSQGSVLSWITMLCSWAVHSTVTVPLFTQEYE